MGKNIFKARGFEMIHVAEFSLHGIMRLFSEARVVAGINGQGPRIFFFHQGHRRDPAVQRHSCAGTPMKRARGPLAEGSPDRRSPAVSAWRFPVGVAHVAAAFEQYCHSFVGGDAIPLLPLAGFLDDVLATWNVRSRNARENGLGRQKVHSRELPRRSDTKSSTAFLTPLHVVNP